MNSLEITQQIAKKLQSRLHPDFTIIKASEKIVEAINSLKSVGLTIDEILDIIKDTVK